MKPWPGKPLPLGATADNDGTNFSVFSQNADRVELCIFEPSGHEIRMTLPERSGDLWHGYLAGIGPGQRYGYRVHGPEGDGHRFDPSKLLLDPYARAIQGQVTWDPALLEGSRGIDSAPFVPRSIVMDPGFDWSGDRTLSTPLHETLIYEVHVKGFTARHPKIPESLRGTYAGMVCDKALDHLTALGITAVELLPVHQHLHDHFLQARGLRNFWGYQTIGYFAPHGEYSSVGDGGDQVDEFKRMVKTFHQAGIEVILDVVYNHTGEGGATGPTLCFRGIDDTSYYRHDPEKREEYMDYTGTGNSLNMRNPHVLQLIMDSLRYWVQEMHVDGFRFDLAATLARELHDVDRLSAFFDVIQQDPIVSGVKLIAEPWDLGEGGYQVGNFPPLWSEWNGKYRDTVRDYWRGGSAGLSELAYRLTGSSDLYRTDARHPSASINFVTSHDGFTLRDLVSYESKHNEANGEQNRDGDDDNRSSNYGIEGETDDQDLKALRSKQIRNFLTTLLVSQGVPMLLGGDELGRTQLGNNNAYCQDNEISWFDWELDEQARALLLFTRDVISLRKQHPVLRRRHFFQGQALHGSGITDIAWITPGGDEMNNEDWAHDFGRSIAIFLNGDEIPEVDSKGQRLSGESLMLLFNAHTEKIDFVVPRRFGGIHWEIVLSTAASLDKSQQVTVAPGESIRVQDRSVSILKRVD